MTATSYDAIVIGTGQAGKPLAKSLATSGRRTAILEREPRVGGTCIVTGCTPTKTMVASARVAYLARRGADYGVHCERASVDLRRVRERKRAIVDKFSGGARKGLESQKNLDLFFGEATFVSPRELRLHRDGNERRLEAPLIFIDTGTRPRIPDIEGLAEVPFLTNASVMELDRVPRHLAVVGGGYVGLEFGQMFRRFGAEVTVIHRGAQLLPREDEDVASEIAGILREDGITISLSSRPTRAWRDGEGGTTLAVSTPDGEAEVQASHVLVATGRVPNTDRLGLPSAGIATDDAGFIRVNERLETNVPGIYALGDVKGGPAFTHISYDDYRVVENNVIHGGSATIENRIVPYCVFIDPELGRVGLGEREARARSLRFRVAKLPMSRVARALELDETRGFMKALVEEESGRILGAAILGVGGGEVMSVVEVAMMGGLSYTSLRDGVFAHPTLSESLNNLFATL